MSLSTDRFFYQALTADTDVTAIVGTRIANPALTYEQEDKWPLPYMVIALEGVQNGNGTKDEVGGSDEDTSTVSVLCVAANRDALATLAQTARTAIRTAFEEMSGWATLGFEIMDYQFNADGVQLDPDKPCVYQTLRYVCDVQNT